MLQARFRAWEARLFNRNVTISAQGNEIIQLICLFVIAIEFSVGRYVMNVYFALICPALLAAYLALVVIPSNRFSTLSRPGRTPVVFLPAAFISSVEGAAHVLRPVLVMTLFRAAGAFATFNLRFMDSVFFAATCAGERYKVLWLSLTRSWLARGIFRSALARAKTRLSVSPVLKLLVAPLAGEYSSLGGIRTGAGPTRFAAIKLSGEARSGKGVTEFFAALRAYLHSASLSLYLEVWPAGGEIDRFSGSYSLADYLMLPQNGAES